MLTSRFLAQVALSFVLVASANAESHVIKFVNQCGYGSPALMYNGQNVLTSDSYTSNGPFSGIAYLQTGSCNINGENCTLLETTLINPTCAGCGSSTDLSLISPHVYSVETSFAYYNGCDGMGQTCSNPSCTSAAFFAPNDNFVQVACQATDVNLLVAFCADAAQVVTGNAATTSGGSSPTNSPPTPSSSPSLGPSTPTSSGTPSTPGSVAPPTTTPTPTPTNTNNSGCGDEPGTTTPSSTPTQTATPSGTPTSEPGQTTPSSTPTSTTPTQTPSNVSNPGCDEPGQTTPSSTPTQTPTNISDPGCDEPGQTTPTPPAGSPSASPTTSRRCRPRPTGLTTSGSVPTSPAYTPTPTPTPSFTPSTTPSTGTGTSDPCDGLSGTSTPSQAPTPVQRRRHRRTNRISY